MTRKRTGIGNLGLLLSISVTGFGQPAIQRSAYHDYRVVTVADGLEHPWSIAFLPGGDMLVTEQPGRLRLVRDGKLLADFVPGVLPEVHYKGQGGFMDVVPHPDFARNRFLYLSYSKPCSDGDGATTAVVRGRSEGDPRQGPDGCIYVAIDGNEKADKTPIYRLEPAEGE